MPKARWLALLSGILLWASLAISYVVPNPVTEVMTPVLLVILLFGLPVTIISGIVEHGAFSRAWLPPPTICAAFIASLWFAGPIREYFSNLQFKSRMGEYTSFVDDVKSRRIPTGETLEMLDLKENRLLPGRSIAVWAAHCGHGTVVVEFLISAAGRVHSGYVYDDCDNPAISVLHGDPRRPDFYVIPVSGAWYEFSDA